VIAAAFKRCAHISEPRCITALGDYVEMLNMILYGIWEHGNALWVKCFHELNKKSLSCGTW
jgi:hypothetical protein